MLWSKSVGSKLVSEDLSQTMIALGFCDVSIQWWDFFSSAQCTPLLGWAGWKKKYILYQIKLLFPPDSQKNDRNNALFMASDSRRWGKKQGRIRFPFISFFSSLHTLLLTSAKNKKTGILMFKKITLLLAAIESNCKQCRL